MPYRLARDHAVAWFLAAWPLLVGLTITLFQDRFTSSNWRFASGVPGGYGTWAGALMVCGVLMLWAMVWGGERREAGYLAGLVLVGFWWWLLGAVFIYNAIRDPLANPFGGISVWIPIGFLYWMTARYEFKRFR